MANGIMTQELAETIAAYTAKKIPIVERINTDLSDKLGEGSGEVVNVLVPGYNPVSEGPSFLNAAGQVVGMDINVSKVPVEVKQKKIGAQLNILEKSLKMNTFKTQVADPQASKLASHINTDVFRTVLGAASSSVVGQMNFGDLATAVETVATSRVGDKISGMLAPLGSSVIVGTGANKFANDKLGRQLYDGEIGEFNGAEFFKSPDAGSLIIGTLGANPAFAVSGTVAQIADGATSLQFTPAAGAPSFIPPGTPFVIGTGTAGVNGSIQSAYTVADVFGNDTGIARTFVALPNPNSANGNYTLTAGTPVNIAIAQVKMVTLNTDGTVTPSSSAFTNAAGTTNVENVPNTFYNANSTISVTNCICPLFSGTKYYLGAVFADKAVAFASMQPKPYASPSDSQGSNLDGEVNVLISTIPAGAEGVDRWRIDVLYGVAPLYGAGAVALYIQAL